MTDVASYVSLVRVNGPGRRALAEAVKRHREGRGWSRPQMAAGVENLSIGTIQNVETKGGDVRERTLAALDIVFSWEPGAARAVLVENAAAPALPQRAPARSATGMARRLQAEIEDGEVTDVRVINLGSHSGKIVISLVGEPDQTLDELRRAVLELDDLFRKWHGEEA